MHTRHGPSNNAILPAVIFHLAAAVQEFAGTKRYRSLRLIVQRNAVPNAASAGTTGQRSPTTPVPGR